LACALALLPAMFAGFTQAATVQYVYDDLGRLVSEIDPVRGTTTYTYDSAGNLRSVTRGDATQLALGSFAPTSGGIGTTVTLFGTGFIPNAAQNSVSFNGTPATVLSATSTSLVVGVPAGAMTGPITVTNANGSAASAQTFTVLATPVIAALSPNAAARGETTRVEISGSNLATVTAVTFSQSGVTGSILPGATEQSLMVDIVVSNSVPLGFYGFTVTNTAGASASGAVAVAVYLPVMGSSMSVSRPVSVYNPPLAAPMGPTMSVSPAVSVSMP
jgi:YD repeat-containing protein